MDVVPSDNKGNFIHQMLTCQVSDWQFVFNRNIFFSQINVREHRRGNQQWTFQRSWQHRVHKTEKNTEKLATQSTQDGEKHRETGNTEYTRRRKTKQSKTKHNILFFLKVRISKFDILMNINSSISIYIPVN